MAGALLLTQATIYGKVVDHFKLVHRIINS